MRTIFLQGDRPEYIATGSHGVDLTGMPENFTGHILKRRQQPIKIWLITKGLFLVIMTVCLPVVESDPKSLECHEIWRERDEIAKDMILMGLFDMLFDVYCTLYGDSQRSLGLSWIGNIVPMTTVFKSIPSGSHSSLQFDFTVFKEINSTLL
ncbi:unnamed protein product [Cuscuta epithymum]|uniref:Uncharacterized protein n=1 Tax=Cuscuta epithymum TaxID=186058 RepID=A0AAV0GBE2_9ASTE|nr:unnamed protein product [Cuscuta epithymum]